MENLRTSGNVVKRILTKGRLDRQMSGQSLAASPSLNIREETSSSKKTVF